MGSNHKAKVYLGF